MNLVDTYLSHYGTFLEKALSKNSSLGAVPPSTAAFFALAIFRQHKSATVVVTSSNTQAEHLLEECSLFLTQDLGGAEMLFFPGYENLPYSSGGISPSIITQRMRCLDQLLSQSNPKLVFTTADAVLRSLPAKQRFYKLALYVETDREYEPRQLLRDLIFLGYNRVERVEAPGDLCMKGSVVDVFPVNLEQAIRIDYFDNIIESVCFFDTESQRNQRAIDKTKVPILPSSEVILDQEESTRLITKLEKAHHDAGEKIPLWANTKEANGKVLAQLHCPGLESLFPLVMEAGSLLDYFPKPPLVLSYPGLEVRECFSRIRKKGNAEKL